MASLTHSMRRGASARAMGSMLGRKVRVWPRAVFGATRSRALGYQRRRLSIRFAPVLWGRLKPADMPF